MSRTFWFSPVPPARTDIAQYSARVVPHLAPLINLEVVHPDTGRIDRSSDQQGIPSLPMAGITLRDLNASHASIYNIGNNPVFHAEILRASMRHPGIVILHDRAVQDLCHAVFDMDRASDETAGAYRAAMLRWYGRAGREAARAALAGEVMVSALAKDFPLFEVTLDGALGAVTHNPEVAAEIAERFPGMPVIALHLPYNDTIKARQNIPALRQDQPIRLAMFGYLGPNRRLCEFLRAWAESPYRNRFEFDLAGEFHNEPEIRSVIAETGLGPQIRNHGFLPDDDLDALIGRAHLVFNLRNPTMGEASGSQLRIWANGAASAISNTGWYGQLPEGSALRVSTENEHADLLALLKDLATGQADLASVARCGGECLGAADPAAYASSLAEWLEREREPMFKRWSEAALIEATAKAFARCTPPRFVPKLPERLLA